MTRGTSVGVVTGESSEDPDTPWENSCLWRSGRLVMGESGCPEGTVDSLGS